MEPSEEGAFSQPADWRSLLSFSKEEAETEEKPTEIETSTDQSWRDLLSLSEESSENYPEDSSISELSEEISAAQVFESQETAFQEETPNQNQHKPDSSMPLPQNNPNEVSPLPKPRSQEPPPVRQTPRFALWELLASAGFTGLEGALLLIALASVFGGVSGISIGLWGMSMGGLVYAQWKRFIEKIDFLIIGAITLAVVALIPPLRSLHGITAVMVIIWSFTVSAGAIAFAALFGLIYRLLSRSK
jgi:serine/threonine-protein kinase